MLGRAVCHFKKGACDKVCSLQLGNRKTATELLMLRAALSCRTVIGENRKYKYLDQTENTELQYLKLCVVFFIKIVKVQIRNVLIKLFNQDVHR